MKKIFIFIIFVIVLGLGFLYSNNEQVWKRNVLSYLNNTYTGKFELVNTDKDKNKYTFLFCTDDDNRIQFEVKCWIGGYDTPWGTINFIPQRHYVDNFSEKIIKNTISETEIYDMTNKTIDEIIEFLKIKLEIIQYNYTLYDITYKNPKININIKYNGKTKQIIYSNQDDNILHDILVEMFF